MRRLLAPFLLVLLLLGGLWLGGESLLAQQMRRIADRQPMVELGAAQPLRDAGRIGVRALALGLQVGQGRVELPQAELWLAPFRPTTLRLALPPHAVLHPGWGDAGQDALELGLADATARLRLQPLSGLGVASAGISAGRLTLGGAELAKGLQADAEHAALGADAPPDAAAAYDLGLNLDDLEPGLLGALPLPGRLSMTAAGRIWLDALPRPLAPASTQAPLPVGLRLDRAEIRIGALKARLLGRVEADPQGRAQGRIVVYTADAQPLLQAAAKAGLISPKVVTLAGTLLGNISDLPLPEQDGHPVPPPAAQGELRLPLSFADGRTSLGPMVLGPAPAFPRR
ncbi:DUF2125 domain-containing protein [Paracoccus thiocyanatus]|uniref:DUF2125 domain-containing protein n=1 Tax=Paracoccus thiocyanatus TaxID=34006 RepID=A0A3D8PAU9_9RHOB|nr:DUF2125 domain-containing protein [Paracoccus thiocyanatus]RDW13196.1 hypothetical protein DIE28_09475 [Paracoccus thiocyanatus]